jgi:hypothetical protein
LTQHDWQCIPYFLYSITPYCRASDILGGSNYPTLYQVLIIILGLLSTPEPISIDGKPVHSRALAFHNKIKESARARIGRLDRHELLAAALDPRQNSLPFLNSVQRAEVAAIEEELVRVRPPSTEVKAPPPAVPQFILGMDWVSSLLATRLSSNEVKVDPSVSTLWQMYQMEEPLKPSDDPRQHWASMKPSHKYYEFAQLALRLWTIPASSLPCERIFSSAGNIVTVKRTRLTGPRVDELVFLYNNRDILYELSIDELMLKSIDDHDSDDDSDDDDI